MERINNKHLAKLWDFMMTNYNSKYAGAPAGNIIIDVFEKFLECDEALSELQDERDHWKTMYANACGDQDVLKESIRLLDTENRRLEAENKEWKKRCDGMRNRRLDTITTNDKTINQLRNIITKDNEEMSQLRTENEDLKKEYKSLQGLNVDIIKKHNEEMNQLRKDNESLGRVIKRHIDTTTVNKNTIYQLRKDNESLASAVNSKDDELRVLQKECDKLKNDYEKLKISRDAWSSRARNAEEYLINSSYTWRDRARNAEKEIDELKKDCAYMTNSRDTWSSRAKHAEEELRTTEKVLDNIRAELEAKVKRMDEITKERDYYRDHYTELKNNTQYIEKFVDGVTDRVKADYEKKLEQLKKEHEGLQARTECLREEVKWYRKHYKEQYNKTQELKSRLNSMCGDEYVKKLHDSVHDLGYKQGQTDLWNMLQHVSNYYYFGTDDQFNTDECDATSMEDIIDIHDLDSFIECYEKWDRR